MSKQHFQAQQIKALLQKFSSKQVTGTLKIALQAKDKLTQKNYLLVLNKGEIAYGGSYIPERDDFVKGLAQKINPKISPVAVEVHKPYFCYRGIEQPCPSSSIDLGTN